jgi:putative hemolysin
MATHGRRGACVARLRQDSNRCLAAVQIGVTLAGLFSAAYGGSTPAHRLGSVVARLGLSEGLADTLALIVVTAAISYLSLVLGELVPERVCCPNQPMSLVRLLGLDPEAGGEQVTEEELRGMVVTQQQRTVEERRVLAEVFDATDRKLSEVMVPRTEVDFLIATTPLAQGAQHVLSRPHSCYP